MVDCMKIKAHIDINTYEFVEFEIEEMDFDIYYQKYHKIGERLIKWKRPKEDLIIENNQAAL